MSTSKVEHHDDTPVTIASVERNNAYWLPVLSKVLRNTDMSRIYPVSNTIIVFVLSTITDEKPEIIDDHQILFNYEFIERQRRDLEKNISKLSKKFLRKQPKLFVIHFNKFDVISPFRPDDVRSTASKEIVQSLFDEHLKLIERKAIELNIEKTVIYGSTLHTYNSTSLFGNLIDEVIEKNIKFK